jgi:hypothetical protein
MTNEFVVGDFQSRTTWRAAEHEPSTTTGRQEVLMGRIHFQSVLLDILSGDSGEHHSSVSNCLDHRSIQALNCTNHNPPSHRNFGQQVIRLGLTLAVTDHFVSLEDCPLTKE